MNRLATNRQTLAWCFIGDEENVEKIADILSSKGQGAAAMELREMAVADRRSPARKSSLLKRWLG